MWGDGSMNWDFLQITVTFLAVLYSAFLIVCEVLRIRTATNNRVRVSIKKTENEEFRRLRRD